MTSWESFQLSLSLFLSPSILLIPGNWMEMPQESPFFHKISYSSNNTAVCVRVWRSPGQGSSHLWAHWEFIFPVTSEGSLQCCSKDCTTGLGEGGKCCYSEMHLNHGLDLNSFKAETWSSSHAFQFQGWTCWVIALLWVCTVTQTTVTTMCKGSQETQNLLMRE